MTAHFPPGRPALSDQALSIWAKTVIHDPTDPHYLQLWQHMADTGETALLVWDHFVADSVKATIAADVGDERIARELYRFTAAVHDVGKASPAFVVQNSCRADIVRGTGLCVAGDIAGDRFRSQYRHELVGYDALHQWLQSQQADRSVAGGRHLAHGIASVVAGHHGTSLTREKREYLHRFNAGRYVGDGPWRAVRNELLDWAADVTGFRDVLRAMQGRPLRRRTQLLLTSLVIIADWIASDSRMVPLNDGPADELVHDARRRAGRAWSMLGLPAPWKAHTGGLSPDDLFAQRFAISGARLRPVQRQVVELARSMDQPGLVIVEANMGEGKTEAALLAAEVLAERFACGGVYYALPSQATVNAMFTRVLDWVSRLPSGPQGSVGSLFLAHGKNELNDDYAALRERWFDDGGSLDGRFGGAPMGCVDDDVNDVDENGRMERRDGRYDGEHDVMQAVVNAWLTGRKRGNLSDFVVGTIDQVLMAGLKSKHVVLRHLALCGKVVVLDEIHSNTAYMNVYMETVLSWLGAYGVPVIMLSATLPQERRQAFLAAYRDGAVAAETVEAIEDCESDAAMPCSGDALLSQWLGTPDQEPGERSSAALRTTANETIPDDVVSSGAAAPAGASADCVDLRYPLVSKADADGVHESLAPESSGRATDIRVTMIADDDAALVATLRERLAQGGCAVVIRNTVTRAQHAYDLLQDALGGDMDVTLAHARFLAFDRARIDRGLIERYGKHGDPGRRSGVVVATQVVEQSLDVDFDLMITDIAPVDLVLQRAGRLHRHHRGDGECERPAPLRDARLIVTGVTWHDDGPPRFATGLEMVYQRYLLMRSLAILGVRPGVEVRMAIPEAIPRLVQGVYGEVPICPQAWRGGDHGEIAAKTTLDAERSKSEESARQYRIFGPQDMRSPFDVDDWLRQSVADPDTTGRAADRQARASVRDGEDSFDVIVLQQGEDGSLDLPHWGDFGASSPLPNGIGGLSRQQVRDIMSCTISLSRFSLAYLPVDAVIKAFERDAPAQWHEYMRQERALRGQLLVTLDTFDTPGRKKYPIFTVLKNGERIERTLQLQYSTIRGWFADVSD